MPFLTSGQSKEAEQFFKKATRNFNAGKYQLADSLISESIKLNPTRDAYYLLAKIKGEKGDSCEYCMNLKESYRWVEEDRYQEFEKYCVIIDTFTYNNFRLKDHSCISVLTHEKYSKEILQTFSVVKPDSTTKYSFQIMLNDSICMSERPVKFPNPFDPNLRIKFTDSEDLPEFPGGDAALYQFLGRTIIYPEEALELGIMGRVVVQFTITKDGTLSDIKVIESPHPILTKEALEVLKYMPKWIPAKVEGRPVELVRYNLPMKFTLR